MLRYEDLNDITDGKTYQLDDMVPCNTNGCDGCSKCCESDMGKSIVLDPHDIYQMTKATGKIFDQLLVEFYIEISMIDGLALPNMKMDKGCKFLVDQRCTIHKARPGICRLFPLGRLYQGRDFSYIFQIHECEKKDLTDVKVRDWLGFEDAERHGAFVKKWHTFLKMVRRRVEEADTAYSARSTSPEEDAKAVENSESMEAFSYDKEEAKKAIMTSLLRWFFMNPYDTERDFDSQFEERMRACMKELRGH